MYRISPWALTDQGNAPVKGQVSAHRMVKWLFRKDTESIVERLCILAMLPVSNILWTPLSWLTCPQNLLV